MPIFLHIVINSETLYEDTPFNGFDKLSIIQYYILCLIIIFLFIKIEFSNQ